MSIQKVFVENLEKQTILLKKLMLAKPITLYRVIKERSKLNFGCVYLITDPKDEKVLYVGKTNYFSKRVKDHLTCDNVSDLNIKVRYHSLSYGRIDYYRIRYLPVGSIRMRGFLEHFVIGVLRPPLNRTGK